MKIIDRKEAIKLVHELKQQGKRVGFTNGCFDILHIGHVRYLEAARQQGDILIVGLNSDVSVKQLKGPERPINSELDRAEVLAALESVSYVVLFQEKTAEAIVEELKPDVYVKGGDYSLDKLPEARIVKAYGGQVVLVSEVPGRSSTKVINKIKELKGSC